MDDRQTSVAQHYSALSTDELLFILATKKLTADAMQSLERELKGRGVNDVELQVDEVLKDQEQFAEYDRRGTPAYFFWAMVMWMGIGLSLASLAEFLYGSIPYGLFVGGLLMFVAGLWMLKRSRHGVGA